MSYEIKSIPNIIGKFLRTGSKSFLGFAIGSFIPFLYFAYSLISDAEPIIKFGVICFVGLLNALFLLIISSHLRKSQSLKKYNDLYNTKSYDYYDEN